ncbi:hypothetical protein ASF71_20765 [Deinococcus sp. Leaf326]|nr:hypothetical protein ASF71_20765 [Deinococcus sp. Leaf326]
MTRLYPKSTLPRERGGPGSLAVGEAAPYAGGESFLHGRVQAEGGQETVVAIPRFNPCLSGEGREDVSRRSQAHAPVVAEWHFCLHAGTYPPSCTRRIGQFIGHVVLTHAKAPGQSDGARVLHVLAAPTHAVLDLDGQIAA